MFFIKNARDKTLSNSVSEQVKQDVSKWAAKAYDINNTVAQSDGHQEIDPYNVMMQPNLLFPITYRNHHATTRNLKTENKNEEGNIQDSVVQGKITDEEEIAIRNYLNQLNGKDTDIEGINETNSKPTENRLSATNEELVELQKQKGPDNRAPEDINRAREPITFEDKRKLWEVIRI